MRVCHITAHPMYDGRIFYRECCSLVKAGYEVHLVVPCEESGVEDGVYVHAYPQVKNRFVRMFFMPWVALWLALKSKAEIYHFHDPPLIPIGLVLKLLKRAHVIYDVHEDHRLMLFKHYIPKGLRKLVSVIVNRVENFGAKRFDAVVTPTEPITTRFAKIAPRATTLYNFPTDDFIQSADKSAVPIEECIYDVVHVGVLREGRLEFLLDVAAEVQGKLGLQKWVFVGMPVYLEPMAKRLAEYRALESVTLVPRMPYLKIPNIICRSKIAVNFHPLGEAHTEVAIPVKIFEYLVCGLPVVSTHLPLVVKLLGDTPAVTLVDDKLSNFSKAVIDLLTDPELMQKSNTASEYARERYSWKTEEPKLLDLYGSILQD